MKVALVHELLTMRGGAERVLRVLADMYPDAPIYTLLYDEKKLGDWFPKERVRPSSLNRYAWLSTNHHLYLPFFPRAVEQWDFSEFDLVISTSSAFAHGIITNSAPKHISYIHSPARYLWDRTHEVINQSSKGILGPLRRWYASTLFMKLRIWDSEAADRADRILAASKEVQRRIELYWRRESAVLYPPIDDVWFTEPVSQSPKPKAQSYFLIVSTLARYKRIDLAIEACNQWKVPLKIVGEGADMQRLKKMAGPTIEFLGYQSHEAVRQFYEGAKATIFPGEEDFGLVPLESMACGTPVIAFRGGGALETMIEGKTGEFFDEKTPQSLVQAMQMLEAKEYDIQALHEQAQHFSRAKFEEGIRQAVRALSDKTYA